MIALKRIDLQILGDMTADLGSLSELAECLYPRGSRELEERTAIELVLSTASRCHNCTTIIYDEEIMAGWQPEDSNLNTVCQFCDKATVPLLTVTILDYRYRFNFYESFRAFNLYSIIFFSVSFMVFFYISILSA